MASLSRHVQHTGHDGTNKAATRKRRACDACSTIKEKCTYPDASSVCHRCQRLTRQCHILRPSNKIGRPRRDRPLTTTHVPKLPQALNPYGSITRNLSPAEEYMLTQFLDLSRLSAFVVVQSIARTMHQQAVYSFFHDYTNISDAVYSMFGAFISGKSPCLSGHDGETNIRRSTVALKRFSARASPCTVLDFVPWLWHGLSIIIHAFCALGSNASPVRRHLLAHLQILKTQGQDLTSHPVVVSLIMADIGESLMYTRRPIMNIPDGYPLGKDSFYGLSLPLWRFAHQLCNISHGVGIGRAEDGAYQPDALLALDKLEDEVERWRPDITPDLFNSLTTVEAVQFSTQIRALQTMILLLIFRTRHLANENDALAVRMARMLLKDLDLATVMAGSPAPFVALPFIVAAIELIDADDRARALEQVHVNVYPSFQKAQEMVVTFLTALWRVRDQSGRSRWLDVMEFLPPLCIRI